MRYSHWLQHRKQFNEKLLKATTIKEIFEIENAKNKQIVQEGISSVTVIGSCVIVGLILSLIIWRIPTFLLVREFNSN